MNHCSKETNQDFVPPPHMEFRYLDGASATRAFSVEVKEWILVLHQSLPPCRLTPKETKSKRETSDFRERRSPKTFLISAGTCLEESGRDGKKSPQGWDVFIFVARCKKASSFPRNSFISSHSPPSTPTTQKQTLIRSTLQFSPAPPRNLYTQSRRPFPENKRKEWHPMSNDRLEHLILNLDTGGVAKLFPPPRFCHQSLPHPLVV
ncbi:hypothetical protein CEXT_506981 [Caerostris extrusa]|uniref:Uncharacterized protein n=1 Tax=Caerostris extrusa TaxID=172846 RepID=A0AAV4NJX5_CAEEX|nr:hypothetical protein CEXT_506981 [Caerostris extrusa]